MFGERIVQSRLIWKMRYIWKQNILLTNRGWTQYCSKKKTFSLGSGFKRYFLLRVFNNSIYLHFCYFENVPVHMQLYHSLIAKIFNIVFCQNIVPYSPCTDYKTTAGTAHRTTRFGSHTVRTLVPPRDLGPTLFLSLHPVLLHPTAKKKIV